MKPQGLYDPQFEHDSCGVGFVCNIKGQRSNEIVKQGLQVLSRLAHRGATGADPKTGDGAGILIQLPYEFLTRVCTENDITLPKPGYYGAGLVFLPTRREEREYCKKVFAHTIKKQGQQLLGWRPVPVDNSDIGKTACSTEPVIEQVFIGKSQDLKDELSFERRLYIIRKLVENEIRSSSLQQKKSFYITNLSCRTLSYKGLLMPVQVDRFFLDLRRDDLRSAICLVHSRYSTNTFPTWDLAQPFRFLAHNGEINTLRGNINWMRAKEGLLKSKLFGADLENIFPVVVPGGSDSATIDNVFELLVLGGRSLAQAMSMLIPSAWEHDDEMPPALKDFYLYHTCLMEPWDGPAAMAFTDGTQIGAMLDRNGLRPARYLVTKNDLVVMASEVGVLDIPPAEILQSGRLKPGKIFFIDTKKGLIIDDQEVKEQMAGRLPYSEWIRDNMLNLDSLPEAVVNPLDKSFYLKSRDVMADMKAFGYTREDLKIILKPMVETGQEPVGSMGNDAPHAILSKQPQLLYNYFKQLFAQVTNPAIDPIREELVMSLESFMGPRHNIMEEVAQNCRKLRVDQPILTNEELARIQSIKEPGFRAKRISILFQAGEEKDFMHALDRVCLDAAHAIKAGFTFIILSDRGVDREHAAIPALLAVGAVHQSLVKSGLRAQIAIIVESGEPREVNHFALLLAFGAGVINPYLAYEAIEHIILEGEAHIRLEKAIDNYIKAINKGIKKILSKMGISTLQSYRGAQIYEALGLGKDVIEQCFTGTVSRIGGATMRVLAREAIMRHQQAYPERESFEVPYLASGGLYQWRRDGEFHLWNPESIAALQDAVRNGNYERFKDFSRLINDQAEHPTTLRSLFKFKKNNPVPLEEVEPVENIVKRFATGAMSFGSISKETHETIALAMNRLGGKSNTGEGGEDPERFKPLPGGDSKRSAIKQVASGRFGVTTNYLVNADELQIKISQGAKPGEGGQLPGHKVSVTIAKTRYTTPGVTLISPPPHHDIYSIEDLAQLIFDLKNTNPQARISVKLVSEVGVGTIAAGVAKGHADMILISGGDGGTGASPVSSIKHAGLPWELGLSETHQTLVLNDLRSRVRLQTDGQLRTGRDVAIAALLGAEEFGFCTAVLVSLGCVMLRHCHLNNCSVGVATQDEELRKHFSGKPEYVVNFFRFVTQELREIMASLGFRTIDEMVGRSDVLELNKDILDWKTKGLDYGKILYIPKSAPAVATRYSIKQNHGIEQVLDKQLIALSKPALEKAAPVKVELGINNTNRATGSMLSGEICKKYGEQGLPEDTIQFQFKGMAGQSFGAWLARGVTFSLEGMANDYVGKGISGGKIIIRPDRKTDYVPQYNIIIGNTAFYGAITGEAFICGLAGERFCIRNSGLNAVVEGVGDHGCEYMTGGQVVILGQTGRNFGAGMSGGLAYIYDDEGVFRNKCNMDMVELEAVNEEDLKIITELLQKHVQYTGSAQANKILSDLAEQRPKFIKVIPMEYKKILESKKRADKLDLEQAYDG